MSSGIILERLKDTTDKQLRDTEVGFQSNRSCNDQVRTIHIVIKCNIVMNLSFYSGFLDYEKAFDSTDRVFF